jgi:hypothetical protein
MILTCPRPPSPQRGKREGNNMDLMESNVKYNELFVLSQFRTSLFNLK